MTPEEGKQLIEAAKRLVITEEHIEKLCEYLDNKEKELIEKELSFDRKEFLNRTYKI